MEKRMKQRVKNAGKVGVGINGSGYMDSNIWFEVLRMPDELSTSEKMWLRTGIVASQYVEEGNKDFLMSILLAYFEKKYNLSLDSLKSGSRKEEIRLPRQMIMHCCATYGQMSLSKIGDVFSQNHSTVYHSKVVINNYIETDKVFRIKYVNMLRAAGLNIAAERLLSKYNELRQVYN